MEEVGDTHHMFLTFGLSGRGRTYFDAANDSFLTHVCVVAHHGLFEASPSQWR